MNRLTFSALALGPVVAFSATALAQDRPELIHDAEQTILAAQNGERWAADDGKIASMVKRHMKMKQQYPDRKATYGIPYGGIENLRPETKEMLEMFKLSLGK